MRNHQHRPKTIGLIKLFVPIFILVLLISACAPPTQDQGQPPATEPQQPTQAQVQNSPLPPQDTAVPDTVAPQPTPTATLPPTIPSTATPYVQVSGNTNCRVGPGSVYDWLHTYLAGDDALITGKSADEAFWYTSDQNGLIPDCWLWGAYATPVGDTSFVPVFTPPPTPTPSPDFAVSYEGSDCAAGSCWLWFKIDNTGSVAWESVLVYTQNIVTYDVAVNISDTFKSGIAESDINKIQPGVSGYTHSERLPNPSGNTVDVYVVACEKDGLNEICLAKHLTANP